MKINAKAKIILDADVLIHFIKGEQTGILNKIFPNDLYLFDVVFKEVFLGSYKTNVERLISFGFVKELQLEQTSQDVKKEYYRLTGKRGGNLGKGESIAMAYCRYNNDVLASSNLSDTIIYCQENTITYLTTMDFLAEAFRIGILSETDCDTFIKVVKSKDSKLVNGVDRIREYNTR